MKPQAILAVLFALCLSLGAGAQDGNRPVGSDGATEVMMVMVHWTTGSINITNADGTSNVINTKRATLNSDLVALLNRLYAEGWQLVVSNGGDNHEAFVLTRKRQ